MALQDGQILVWNATGSNWDNKNPSGGGIITSVDTDNGLSLTDGKLDVHGIGSATSIHGRPIQDLPSDTTKKYTFFYDNGLLKFEEGGGSGGGIVKSTQTTWATVDDNGKLNSTIFIDDPNGDGVDVFMDKTKSIQFYDNSTSNKISLANITSAGLLARTPTSDFEVANKKYVDDNSGGGGEPKTWSEFPATQGVNMAGYNIDKVAYIKNSKDNSNDVRLELSATNNGNIFSGMRITPEGFLMSVKGTDDSSYKAWDPFAGGGGTPVTIANGGFFTKKGSVGSSNSYGNIQNIFSDFAGVNYFDATTNAYYTGITNTQQLRDAFLIGSVETAQKGLGNEVILWFNAGNDLTIKATRDYGIYVPGSFLNFTQVFSFQVPDLSGINFQGPIMVYKYIAILNISDQETRLFVYLNNAAEDQGSYSYANKTWTGANGGIQLISSPTNTTEFFFNIQFIIRTPVTH